MAGEVRKQTWDDLEDTRPLPIVPEASLEDTQPLPMLRHPTPKRRRWLRWVSLAVVALVLGFVTRLAWSDFFAPHLLPPPEASGIRAKNEAAVGATIARTKTTQQLSQPLQKTSTMPVARSNDQAGQKHKPRGGASLAYGKSYVRANCLGCHWVEGEGSGIDLSKVGNKYSAAALKYYLKYEHPMPWKGSDAEREAVAQYLVSLQSSSQAAFASHNEEAKGRATEVKVVKSGGEYRRSASNTRKVTASANIPVPRAPTGLAGYAVITSAEKGSFWTGTPRYIGGRIELSWNPVDGATSYQVYTSADGQGVVTAGPNGIVPKIDAYGRCSYSAGFTFVEDIPETVTVYVTAINEAGKEGPPSERIVVSIPNPWR